MDTLAITLDADTIEALREQLKWSLLTISNSGLLAPLTPSTVAVHATPPD